MFIKFGSEENIKSLFDEGMIYMNSKEYFRKVEDKKLRGDADGGAWRIKLLKEMQAVGLSIDLQTVLKKIWHCQRK